MKKNNSKGVIITVDTEGHVGKDPVKHLIWGETKNGKQCGIPLIMDLCEEVGAKALFFVDIAEAWDYGEDKIAEVMQYIVERGHDVGVHVHPDHMADPKRLFLFEYSYKEQYDIIRKCTEFYKMVLGKTPTAFRAGKYSANYDTLDILPILGYKSDFSEFYGYDKWCGIQPAITGNNTVKMDNELIEVPTMSYFNSIPGLFSRYDKLDINMSMMEHHDILRRLASDSAVDIIVLFAHGFSLLKWRSNVDCPRKRILNIARLHTALVDVVKNPHLYFTSLEEIIGMEHNFEKYGESTASIIKLGTFTSALWAIPKAVHLIHNKIESMESRRNG